MTDIRIKPNLFPRRPKGKRPPAAAAERARAHILLDRAQAGHDIPREDIVWALRVTGDLAPARAFGGQP